MSKDAKVDRLGQVALFNGLSRRDLERLAEITDEVDVKPGRKLTTEGDTAHVAYVIVSGTAAITVDGQQVGMVGPGEMVGEMGLIDGGVRAATVTAETDLDVYIIEPGRFRALLDEVPSLCRNLLVAMTRRLRKTDQLLHRH
jgi:CRP/FNR family transcriptional regulator, cyclic AMP receptor protein